MASPLLLVISENPRRARALADLAGELLPDWRLSTAVGLEAALTHVEGADVMVLATAAGPGVAEQVRRLREQSFPLYKPILAVMEENGGPPALQKAIEAGVDDVLAEPVPPDELASRIRILLMVSRLSHDLTSVRHRESLYRWLVEQAPVGLCLVDQEAVITFASRRLGDLAGHDAQVLVGKRVEELLDEPQRRTFPPRLARCRQGREELHELVLIGDDGRKRPLLALSRPLLDEAGQFAGCVLAWADVRGHDRRDHQARLAERMDSVARLAGQLAHDFNNILTVILGNASLLRRALTNQPENMGLVDEIVKAAKRAAELNRRLVTMGFGRLGATAAVDVHDLLGRVAREMERAPDQPIHVRADLAAASSVARGDEQQLYGALLRLAQTLRDAMPEGGAMAIQTADVTLDALDCETKPFTITPGQYLQVTVADRSAVPVPVALPAGPRHEAAELDLAGVFATIRSHGGSIELDTAEGQGLSCTLLLPLAQEQ